MQVTFTHPRDSRPYKADVAAELTGEMAIQEMVEGAFLTLAPASRPYELYIARSGLQIPPTMTFGQAGVQDGDVLEVYQSAQGA